MTLRTPPIPAAAEWAGLGALVLATTATIAGRGAGPGTAIRHLYVVAALVGALRFGLAGGVAVAALAVLLDAPLLLESIETWGLGAAAAEGCVTVALVVVAGGLAGALVNRARRRLDRYQTVLALQRALAGRPLAEGLLLAGAALRRLLRAEAVELAVRGEDGAWVGARGRRPLQPGSAGAWVAERGRSLYLPDAPPGARSASPRRVLVVPLVAGGQALGVAGVARRLGFSRDERAAIEALGAQVALALENARLRDDLESRIAAATRRLVELDRAKSEFVAIASHELRTPLTSLRGFSELLLFRRCREEEQRHFLAVIHAEAERLGRILDDLLDLARIESGQCADLRPAPLAVAPVLRARAEAFLAQGATHRFRVAAPAGLPAALVDRDALERILTNLVSNAVKYSPAGSEVRLLAAATGPRVEIAVEDDGAGIAPDALPRIFDPYYRAPGGGRGARGLGLGLALVKSLVEASGGAIRVDSAPGAGSRFTVSLPRVP